MLELLYVGWIITLVGAVCIGIVAWVIALIGLLFMRNRDEGEARLILVCLALGLGGAFLWPILLPTAAVLGARGLLGEAGIESLAERRAKHERLLREREAAREIAKSKAIRERDKKIAMLEAQIRPGEVWYPPDWENDRSVDPARRTA